jgi:hypothetical protein
MIKPGAVVAPLTKPQRAIASEISTAGMAWVEVSTDDEVIVRVGRLIVCDAIQFTS